MKPASTAVVKSSGRGGARPNSGRRLGGQNEKTRAYAEAAAVEGVKPIDVMLGNMRYYHERAEDFDKKLEEVATLLTPQQIAAGGESVMEVLKLVNQIGQFRMKAQECAVDAAPYIHPRLTAIAMKLDHGDSKKPPLEITRNLDARVAAERYAELLARDD